MSQFKHWDRWVKRRNEAARRLALQFRDDEVAAAASEYAIVLAFVAAAVAAAVSLFDLTGVFPAIVAKITSLIG